MISLGDKMAGTVVNRLDMDGVGIDSVHNAVRKAEYFSAACVANFWDYAPQLWEASQWLDGRENRADNVARESGRVFFEVAGDMLEVREGRLGPNYFSHFSNRVLASACEATRPAAISSSAFMSFALINKASMTSSMPAASESESITRCASFLTAFMHANYAKVGPQTTKKLHSRTGE